MISSVQAEQLYQSRFFLHQKYVVETLSATRISTLIFSARSTVINALKSFNIPIRPEDGQRALKPGQLKYGERLVKGQVVRHKGELEVVERMREMRRKGLSYRAIASTLEAEGRATKNHKRWHPTTVMNILRSYL